MLEFMRVTMLAAGARTRALLATLRGAGATGQDDDAEPGDRAEVLFPFGLIARPQITDTLEALVLRGEEFVATLLNDKGAAALAPTLEEKETRVYNLEGAYVRLRADGSADLVTASGRAIRLGAAGGTANKPVAHEGSGTTGHTHTAGGYTAGPYAVAGTSASASDTIAAGEGSARVLVPDT
jgi:hypothetical protein